MCGCWVSIFIIFLRPKIRQQFNDWVVEGEFFYSFWNSNGILYEIPGNDLSNSFNILFVGPIWIESFDILSHLFCFIDDNDVVMMVLWDSHVSVLLIEWSDFCFEYLLLSVKLYLNQRLLLIFWDSIALLNERIERFYYFFPRMFCYFWWQIVSLKNHLYFWYKWYLI